MGADRLVLHPKRLAEILSFLVKAARILSYYKSGVTFKSALWINHDFVNDLGYLTLLGNMLGPSACRELFFEYALGVYCDRDISKTNTARLIGGMPADMNEAARQWFNQADSFSTRVVGFGFRKYRFTRPGPDTDSLTISADDPVFVVREPQNNHDSNAVSLLWKNGEKLGYLRRNIAVHIAPLMDQEIDKSILDRISELIQSEKKNDQLRKIVSLIHEYCSDPVRSFSIGLLVRFLFSCLVDADRLSTADFENPQGAQLRYLGKYPDWQNLIDCFEQISFENKNEVDQTRQEISSSCRQRANDVLGLYYLTVPTGGGKTFSSLRFALHHAKKHNLERIIYVIPYTSIIDQKCIECSENF